MAQAGGVAGGETVTADTYSSYGMLGSQGGGQAGPDSGALMLLPADGM